MELEDDTSFIRALTGLSTKDNRNDSTDSDEIVNLHHISSTTEYIAVQYAVSSSLLLVSSVVFCVLLQFNSSYF